MEAVAPSASAARPVVRVNPNVALALVALARFMVVLEATVVNVAPPTKGDLGFSERNLSWVLNAYTLTFGFRTDTRR
jgi:hypothetical protein